MQNVNHVLPYGDSNFVDDIDPHSRPNLPKEKTLAHSNEQRLHLVDDEMDDPGGPNRIFSR